MGAGNSAFTSKELDDYQDWTYLTKKEIITAFNRFMALAELEDDKAKIRAKEGKKNHYLDAKWMDKFPELQVNPFKTRILEGEKVIFFLSSCLLLSVVILNTNMILPKRLFYLHYCPCPVPTQ